MIMLRLYYEFFKVGLFAVGGGLATLPFLQRLGESSGWFTAAQLADMLAVSESTPGPIGINMAAYVGFELHGVSGAAAAVLGLTTPSLVIILLIATVLKSYRRDQRVAAVFYGLRPASLALITAAGLSLLWLCLLDIDRFAATGQVLSLIRWPELLLAVTVLVLTRWVKPLKRLHPIVFITFSAAVGIIFAM